MTLGQRIAEQRKKLGLSQEALGERLGLSRQAVSKWEADAAVPEVDKLIALSKLFSVPVGWLLGVEEEISSAQSKEEGLTDVQLKLVEEIVQRYLASRPEPALTRRERWWNSPKTRMLLAFAFLILLIAGIKVGGSIGTELSRYQSNVSGLADSYQLLQEQISGLQYRMDALAGQVEEQLEARTKFLSDWSLEPEAWDNLEGATIRFSAIPKTVREGDEGVLSVQLEGIETARVAGEWNGTAYTGQVELEAADGYCYYFILNHADGSQEIQALSTLSELKSYYAVYLKEGMHLQFEVWVDNWRDQNGFLTVDAWRLDYAAPGLCSEPDEFRVKGLEYILCVNGEETRREAVDIEGFGGETQLSLDSTGQLFQIQLYPGDRLELRFVLELENGETLETNAQSWFYDRESQILMVE